MPRPVRGHIDGAPACRWSSSHWRPGDLRAAQSQASHRGFVSLDGLELLLRRSRLWNVKQSLVHLTEFRQLRNPGLNRRARLRVYKDKTCHPLVSKPPEVLELRAVATSERRCQQTVGTFKTEDPSVDLRVEISTGVRVLRASRLGDLRIGLL